MSVARARSLRKTMTPPELALWFRLRLLKANGWHFRRQSPEGRYVLDFVCRSANLVVEVDGVHHSDRAQSERDAERDNFLYGRGFKVLRFWASDVMNERDGVMQSIMSALGDPSAAVAERPAKLKGGARYRQLVRLGMRKKPND